MVVASSLRVVGSLLALTVLFAAATAAQPVSAIEPASKAAGLRRVRFVPPPIDEVRVAAAGIRKLSGEHLTLYTDLPKSGAHDQLVEAFDQAYPQWCEYFGLTPRRDPPWRATACLMGDKQKFLDSGLLPGDLPKFTFAFFRGDRLWINEQPNSYYRRHLLLHEGTHAFMDALLGNCGPVWYSEGIAELLGTHSLDDNRVKLRYFPTDAETVPLWGRVRLVHDAIEAGRRLKLDDVFQYDERSTLEGEPYGWCWALAAFLDGHPRYRERFRKLPPRLDAEDFTAEVRKLYAADWPQLAEEWQLFTDNLEYGYDLGREAIDFRPGKPLSKVGEVIEVATDRGWQSSGVRLEAGKSYHLVASGRYQVAAEPRPWVCEPAGVTVRYWHGKPLGILLAAIHPEPSDPTVESAFLDPLAIGREATIRPEVSGTLYLRINDSPAELADNSGTLEVRVTAESP